MNTSLKTCFKCGAEKLLTDFYKHAAMGDGYLGKCKECAKLDMRLHSQKPEVRQQQAAYDRERAKRPERRAKKLQYDKARRQRDPVRAKAWNAIYNAIRDGRLVRKPCEVCGETKSQAHHLDYSKPLAVRWLCFEHHRAVHGQRLREEESVYAA